MRRRGISPEAIRAFADLVGVAKVNSTVDLEKLEFCVRDDVNWTAPRVMGVLRPLDLTITSWPEGEVEQLTAPYFPPDIGKPGERTIPFGRHLLIDRDDFMLDPPPGYQRLAPGRTVRLRYGPCITCDEVLTENGQVVEVRGHHVPDSIGTNPPGVNIAGVIHWVPAAPAVPAEGRLYDRLFLDVRPDEASGDEINPDSLEVVDGVRLEPSLAGASPGSRWQLERVGYFVFDALDSRPDALVINRIVTLRDSWQAKPAAAATEPAAPKEAKTSTRPPKRSRIEYRAEGRVRDPLLADRFATWPTRFGLSEHDVDLLTADRPTGDLFAEAVAGGAPPAVVARWVINELPRELGDRVVDQTRLTGRGLAGLVLALESGEITGAAAKDVFAEMVDQGGDARGIIAERGLAQVSDEVEIAAMVKTVLDANPAKVDQYRAGKTGLWGFFVGQVVRSSDGKANPQVVQRVLGERLNVPDRIAPRDGPLQTPVAAIGLLLAMPHFHHVNLGVPPDGVDAEATFLVDILGYRLVEVDERLQRMGARWFEADDGSQVHLSADPDHRPASRAHVAIEYGGQLSDVEQRLRRAEVPFDAGEHPGFPRVVNCRDPAGNRWELRGEMASSG